MSDFIPVNTPLLDGNEKKYLIECIDSGWISSEGPFVAEFEKKFAERVGRKHAVAVSNGTCALDLAVEALDIGPGDEVILPTFTIISCITQIIRAGATPILVDVELDTWNMDVSQIEAKITSRTKAIMVVHIYGLPVDMNPVLEIAERHGLRVIEDAAESHGQNYMGRPCGSFGDISTFSFYPNKHITTGEGGMVVTDDDDLAETCRELRNLCFKPEQRFRHDRLGWNMRLTNLQAAVGLAQLEQLDRFITIKREMGRLYTELLCHCDNLQLPPSETSYAENHYWVFGLVLDPSLGLSALQVMDRLRESGIGTRPFFYPMHMQPILCQDGLFSDDRHTNAEHIAEYGFYLPSGLSLTHGEIIRSANALLDIVG
jgi:perosamine synthetase